VNRPTFKRATSSPSMHKSVATPRAVATLGQDRIDVIYVVADTKRLVRQKWRLLNPTMNESARRLWAGTEPMRSATARTR